jgi:adenosylcobinamide-GDP ribazoletransferase
VSDVGDRASGGSLADAVRLAVGTLTVFRTSAPRLVDRRVAGLAMTLAPLVGLATAVPLGVMVWLLGYGPNGADTFVWRWLAPTAVHPPPALVVAVLVVSALALLSRGLHLDGLADTADGLGSGKPATGALEVMRRGDIGPFGVVTLVLVLALQVAAVAHALTTAGGVVAIVVAVVVSRLALPLACLRGTPSARLDGLGAVVAGTVSPAQLLVSAWLAVAAVGGCGVLVLLVEGQMVSAPASSLVGTVAAAGVALLAGWLFVRRCVHRFGGVTGDVLGAAVEVTLSVVLLLLGFL